MKMLRSLLGLSLLFTAAALLRAEPAVPAPAWKLQDLDGHTVSSEQFKGKVVVLDFWATWCGPCRREIPGYIELQKKYGKDGLVIIGVSCDQDSDPAQTVRKLAAKLGINYTMLLADDTVTGAFGGIEYLPTTFLIDRDGIIRDRKDGAMDEAEYEQRILKYLK